MSTNNTYKFFAFISYRHTDIKAAKKLQSLLEGYNLPTEIKTQVKDAPKRFKVFRDTDELTAGVLSEELQKKLYESKFLIVICSPNSAQSKYVGEEITYFRSLGRERQIIPFIIDGVPHSEESECFHPQLTLGGLELLGIDVQAEQGCCESIRFHKAFMRTVAKMLGLDFGALWNKRKRQLIKRAVFTSILSAAALTTICIFAIKAQHEKPFDVTMALNETGVSTDLPLRTDEGVDTMYLYLEKNDARPQVITDLRGKLLFKNIPGRYLNKTVRVVCESFACNKIDTTFILSPHVDLSFTRNPEFFGRIRHLVKERDGETPVAGAEFDFGFIKATTDEQGLLDVLIPLEHQRTNKYNVKINYRGKERKLKWQQEIDPMQGRTDVYDILLE